MCDVMLRYLPDWVAAYQLKTLEVQRRDLKNPLFNFNKTLKAYSDYCHYCFSHPKAPTAEKAKRWQQRIGGVQSGWPVWIRYKFTEIGREAAWPQMAPEKTYVRQDTDTYRCWNELVASGKAMYRHRASQACAIAYLGSRGDYPLDKFNLDNEQHQLMRYRRYQRQRFKALLASGSAYVFHVCQR